MKKIKPNNEQVFSFYTMGKAKRVKEIIDENLARGHNRFKITFDNGATKVCRVTISRDGHYIWLPPRATRFGYYLDIWKIDKIQPIVEPDGIEGFLWNLGQFIEYWKEAHDNVWRETKKKILGIDLDKLYVYAYAVADEEKLREYFVENYGEIGDMFIHWLYYRMNKIYLKSLSPVWKRYEKYTDVGKWRLEKVQKCIENVKKHIENNEEFCYVWETKFYQVTVSAHYDFADNLRTYLYLEGRYSSRTYALLNDKLAIVI